MRPIIEILMADITKIEVDAIINAANNSLLGGGGVDGAIHRAAGPELLEECRSLNGCETGFAKITKGYNLPSKFVIHTVGPVWFGGTFGEEDLLISCYEECLQLAFANRAKSIAFPAISTGVYGFPADQAAFIALNSVTEFLSRYETDFEKIIFVAYDIKTYEEYVRLVADNDEED
jgi:O-acetyl-ADP-ribose deacetylase (regulator of RNase III)